MAPDRDQNQAYLFEWTLPDLLHLDCDIPHQHQESNADHLQWNSDRPSLLHNTESPPSTFPELEQNAAVSVVPVAEHLQQNHQQTNLPFVGTHVAPPPLVPWQNNVRAQQQPMFPEDGQPRNILDLLQHYRASFLFKKKLTTTDTNPSQSRLSVPKSAVQKKFNRPFFSQAEIDKMDSRDGLEVIVFDQNEREYAMRFKLWSSCGTYILLGKWKQFLQNNNLQGKVEAEISMWAFRHHHTGSIAFLIIAP